LHGLSWLGVEPSSATVPPGGSLDLQVTFNAAGLFGGDYNADIVLASNDPDEPEVTVPAHLHVTGAPDIDLSTRALDFGSVFVGGRQTRTVTVSNRGTDVLNV